MPVTLTPKQYWKQTKLLVFSWHFSLFSWSRLKFIQNNCETDKFPSEVSHINFPSFKVKSLFQIMYYHVAGTKHKHVMNAHAVYEKCKNIELITAFNKQYMCISYNSIKSQWSSFGKYNVLRILPVAVPLLVISIHYSFNYVLLL